MTLRGRPPKLLDPSAGDKVCDALRRGNTRRNACRLSSMPLSTFMLWMKLGREGSELHQVFVERVERAEGEAEDEAVGSVRSGNTGWQGSAWWLERRRREAWRRPSQPMVESAEKDLSDVPEEELKRMAESYFVAKYGEKKRVIK